MQKVPLFGVFSVFVGTNEAISTLIWSCRISSNHWFGNITLGRYNQLILAASSNPFGAARAVDTSAKEKEIEQKLKQTTLSDKPKKEFVKKVTM